MRILVTGARGFVGKNLVANLMNVKEGKDRNRNFVVDEVYSYDIDTDPVLLEEYCQKADFVFHLAGVNRPKDQSEFMEGNFGFSSTLLEKLKAANNSCPVMLSSSVQATLIGRYGTSDYGKSKLAGEELFFQYAKETGAKVLVYRFPNLFGKWCRPNYNSAVATFCNNIANDLPIQVNDRSTKLELLYIDDLVEEMFAVLENREHHCEYPTADEVIDGRTYDGLTPREVENGRYCFVPTTHFATLGEIVDFLEAVHRQPETLLMPSIPNHSLEKKLYSTYLSYLPKEKAAFSLHMNCDPRGSFT